MKWGWVDVLGMACVGIAFIAFLCFGVVGALVVGVPLFMGFARYFFDQDDQRRGK